MRLKWSKANLATRTWHKFVVRWRDTPSVRNLIQDTKADLEESAIGDWMIHVVDHDNYFVVAVDNDQDAVRLRITMPGKYVGVVGWVNGKVQYHIR